MRLLPRVKQAPDQTIWISYDGDADVLYGNYKEPSIAADSEMTDDDIILRYADDEIIGMTILRARQR